MVSDNTDIFIRTYLYVHIYTYLCTRVIDKTYKYPYKRYNLLFAISADTII